VPIPLVLEALTLTRPWIGVLDGHDAVLAYVQGNLVDDLDAWTREHFPRAERTHAWSAQDYAPATGMPLVGTIDRSLRSWRGTSQRHEGACARGLRDTRWRSLLRDRGK
jgi:hypothetical protein